MRPLLIIIVTALSMLASPASADDQPPVAVTRKIQKSIEIVRLVEAFTKAQHDFDQPRLRALTAEGYSEISPIGEVDPRDKMLSFYDPADKVEAPAMILGDSSVGMIGRHAAIVITTISYQVPGKEGPHSVAMRAVFVAHREHRTWKLIFAQYTPIRSKS